MKPNEAVRQIIAVMPGGRVVGRKRMQKLAYLLQHSGAPLEATFNIHNYGPFSREIADAIEEASFAGAIKEECLPVGVYGTYQYVYELGVPKSESDAEFSPNTKMLLLTLSGFATVALEVASTIAFFEEQGLSRNDAVAKTRQLKPGKSVSGILNNADKILAVAQRQ